MDVALAGFDKARSALKEHLSRHRPPNVQQKEGSQDDQQPDFKRQRAADGQPARKPDAQEQEAWSEFKEKITLSLNMAQGMAPSTEQSHMLVQKLFDALLAGRPPPRQEASGAAASAAAGPRARGAEDKQQDEDGDSLM